ncbi:MAG: SIR2 family protein [Rickettsiales bacterium]|jgi:hypothetical protein|nr:SIR2 family protein [Rickettsiales bacterium]
MPAISAGGNIENELKELASDPEQSNEYEKKLYGFLAGVQKAQNDIIAGSFIDGAGANNTGNTLSNYEKFITTIVSLLLARNNPIILKRMNIFSTNYDMFIEKAVEEVSPLHVNDGFVGSCRIDAKFPFSTHTFSNCMHNAGDYYKTYIPTINIIKLHGSLSWQSNEVGKIFFGNNSLPELSNDDINDLDTLKERNKKYSNIIIPTLKKFEDTVLMQTYYDLLRIYSNELDKENSVMFVFGFSFNDERILEITKRALKNTTLEVIIFAYGAAEVADFERKFTGFQNVKIVYDSANDANISFERLNSIFSDIKPAEGQDV